MRIKRIVAALLAFAITVGIAGNAYAENTGQALTAEIETAVSDKVQAEAEVSNPEPEQESESKIVRTELTEQNLPDVIDAETAIADGYVARLNSEEQSLSEVVLEKDDGTRALYLFSENVKYIDENGDVADKSNNAVRKGRAFVNEGNDVEIILPATLTAGIAVIGDELNITMKPLTDKIGRSLSPAKKTADDTVVYSDVFDSSTNIEYTYTYGGVKENIILESYNGKNSFDYEITTGGLSLYEDKGTLLLADESGDVKATLGEVVVFSADNKNNTFGKYKVEELEKNSRYKVTVSVDRECLTDPKTKYPVKINPDLKTINASAKIQDLQVFKGTDGKGTSATSAGYSGVSRVGWTDWGACRTLIKLNNFSFNTYKITDAWQIDSAYVELRDLMCQGGSGVPISCGQFNGNFWTEKDTRTWNGLEAENSSLSSPVNVTYGNGNSKRNLSDKDQWYNWNLTGTVKKWLTNASLKEKGLQLRTYASFLEENSIYSDYMKTFSSMQGDADYKPYFVIKYKSNGCRSADTLPRTNEPTKNCLMYATNTNKTIKYTTEYGNGISDTFSYFILTENDVSNITASGSISNAYNITKNRFETWLNKYYKNKWRDVTSDGYKAVLKDDEWLICMRAGNYYNKTSKSFEYDYHFWFRANNGKWHNKHGWYYASEYMDDIVDPSNASGASGWSCGAIKDFYNSKTAYYAIKKN